MKKYISLIVIACMSLSMLSCESWLDVKPKQMVEEEDLFSREDGFKEALTGIYISLANTNLYGERLTYDFLDILAQRYDPVNKSSEHIYQDVQWYNMSNDNTTVSGTISGIWKNMYAVMANINNLLGWLEKKGDVITTEGYYEIIKGEALALRGFVYFDLLRMFGPIYKENPSGNSIIYRTEFNRNIKNLTPANQMIDHIIADLEAAEVLLADDPLDFTRTYESGFLVSRYNRMNLLAVKATLARAYLYRGSVADKQKASAYANQVIQSGKFTLAQNNNSDKFLPSELIFGLYINNYDEKIGDKWDQTSQSSMGINWYISDRAFWQALANLPEDSESDWRMNDITGFYTAGSGGTNYVSYKFMNHGTSASMPVIRLAEMYYILAECEPTLEAAETYLNMVRDARAIEPVILDTEAERLRQLELEYRKEFYGEGQLWYFYKRHFYRTFVNCPVTNLLQVNYIFPIPVGETTHGGVTE